MGRFNVGILFDIPIALGPWGTFLFSLALLILAALNGIQWFQKESRARLKGEIEKWKTVAETSTSTVSFAQSELGLVRDRCERLERENKDLHTANALLRQQTNLEGLQANIDKGREMAVAELMKRIDDMDRRIAEVHVATLRSLEEISTTLKDQHQEFVAQIESNSGLIQSQAEFIKSLQTQLELRKALG